jgi:hypothetical protein
MTCGDRARGRAVPMAVLVGCGLVLGGGAARAQSAEAEVLFRDGRRLIQAGKLAQGCDKLEASDRLESSVGALLNLGDCREKLGELASAWAAFRKAEAQAKHAGNDEKRRAEARRRSAALEPRLVYLVLQIDRPATGLVVRRDGAPVDAALWNTAVPIDPGSYEIAAAAPGFRPWRTRVAIDARLRRRVVAVPELDAEPPAAAPVAVAPRPIAPPPEVHARARRHGIAWTTSRKASAVVAAAGAGALGAGALFGWRAHSLAERADRRCPDVMCGDPTGLSLNADARDAARTANVLYAAGGAAALTAAIFWLAGKSGDTAIRPGVAGGAGISLVGRF